MDETMSGKPMALKVINEINGKLDFLYRKNSFLTPVLRRMLCSALIHQIWIMHARRGTLTLMPRLEKIANNAK